jgi:hypothetical protein
VDDGPPAPGVSVYALTKLDPAYFELGTLVP